MSYWDDLHHHTDMDEIWMGHPIVRRQINLRVTGERDTWTTDWLKQRFEAHLPLGRSASIGCGIGQLERDLVSKGIVQEITGIDLSASCISKAEELARECGYTGRIDYVCGDSREWLRGARELDAVFFHASLHHFERLDQVLASVRDALKPQGFLYLDEYVGPSRHQWNAVRLILPNLAYRMLPRSVRRVGLIRSPINRDDPSEAIRSSRIMPTVERFFRIIERRDYGGNLLSVIYANLRRPNQTPPSSPEDFDRSIRFLLGLEDKLLRYKKLTRAKSYYTTVIAVPR